MSKTFTMRLDPAGRHLTYERGRLIVLEGPDADRDVVSTSSEITVGSSPANDLVLSDGAVSRHHFEIKLDQGLPRIDDLSSTNGTFVNNVGIHSAALQIGDRVHVGHTVLQFLDALGVSKLAVAAESPFENVLGNSPQMLRLFEVLERVAPSDTALLLTGETGTGKSLLGQAVHGASARAEGPIVVLDCGAIAPSLAESALFGHVKGAFTGASGPREGAFRRANGGTLILEEIGDLPLDLQPKLLQALETGDVVPVGSDDVVKVDVRVIAATHRDLRARVNTGEFRADLYYRLAVVACRVPPLRDRLEDLELLINRFYLQFSGGTQDAPPDLVDAFRRREWAGNVRELRAAVERAALLQTLVDSPVLEAIEAEPLGMGDVDLSVPFRVGKEAAVADWERNYLNALLAAHEGNVSAAARAARMDRNYLRERLRLRGVAIGRHRK